MTCSCLECRAARRRESSRRYHRSVTRFTMNAPSSRDPWTPEADEVVLSDITARNAAKILGRTYSAVVSRRRALRRSGGATTA